MEETDETRALPFPFSSKRMKAEWLRRVAMALEVPTTAPIGDLRLMVEGKITEAGRQPENVQTLVEPGLDDQRPMLKLCDEDGVFLEVDLGTRESEGNSVESDTELETGPAFGHGSVSDRISSSMGASTERETVATRFDLVEDKLRATEAELEETHSSLEEAQREIAQLREERIRFLEAAGEVDALKYQLEAQKVKIKYIWRMNCKQISMYHNECCTKDDEIVILKAKLTALEAAGARVHRGERDPRDIIHASPVSTHVQDSPIRVLESYREGDSEEVVVGGARRGKAPPVDAFSATNPEVRFEDWLPTLKRAAEWNRWSDEELLMQLAGYLRGKALQEWNLLGREQKLSFRSAVEALRFRIGPQNRVIAATDFRHALQAEEETVADYIRRIERLFQLAYGGDSDTSETRDTILHGQLHRGLKYDIVKSPAVSGAQSYQELCLAAMQEEKRVAELTRRRLYIRSPTLQSRKKPGEKGQAGTQQPAKQTPASSGRKCYIQPAKQTPASSGRKCYICNSPDHLAKQCKSRKQESRPNQTGNSHKQAARKTVRFGETKAIELDRLEDPKQ